MMNLGRGSKNGMINQTYDKAYNDNYHYQPAVHNSMN